MQIWSVFAVACLVLSASAAASLVEDTLTPVHPALTYQNDAGLPGDATGTCEDVDLDRNIDLTSSRHGFLVDVDDTSDSFVITSAEELVGQRLTFQLIPGVGGDYTELTFDVYDSSCGWSVQDPTAPPYQDTDTRPDESFAVGEGEQLVAGDNLDSYDCNESQWKVHMNQIRDFDAPAEVYMEWTDGSWAYVPLSHASQGTVGMYLYDEKLDVSLAKVETVVPDGWEGRMKLAHAPCDVEEGTIPEPADPATPGAQSLEWTVTESSYYIVVVTLTKGYLDAAQDQGYAAADMAMDPPTSMNMDCHEICTRSIADVEYEMDLSKETT